MLSVDFIEAPNSIHLAFGVPASHNSDEQPNQQ
jgi:hypothetical protein